MNSHYNEGMYALSLIHFRNTESSFSLNPSAYNVNPAKRHLQINEEKLSDK